MVSSLMLFLVRFIQAAASGEAPSWISPLVNLGAIGVCLVALGFYSIAKDKKYEQRIDDRLAVEAQFRKEQAEQTERYRISMEQIRQTLDSVLQVLKRRQGGEWR